MIDKSSPPSSIPSAQELAVVWYCGEWRQCERRGEVIGWRTSHQQFSFVSSTILPLPGHSLTWPHGPSTSTQLKPRDCPKRERLTGVVLHKAIVKKNTQQTNGERSVQELGHQCDAGMWWVGRQSQDTSPQIQNNTDRRMMSGSVCHQEVQGDVGLGWGARMLMLSFGTTIHTCHRNSAVSRGHDMVNS